MEIPSQSYRTLTLSIAERTLYNTEQKKLFHLSSGNIPSTFGVGQYSPRPHFGETISNSDHKASHYFYISSWRIV